MNMCGYIVVYTYICIHESMYEYAYAYASVYAYAYIFMYLCMTCCLLGAARSLLARLLSTGSLECLFAMLAG